MIKILKSKAGMTLIELTISIVLFSIIATAVSAVLVPMLRVYAQANEIAEYNTILDNIANEILSDMECATDISIDGSEATVFMGTKALRYGVSSGMLTRNDAPVFHEGFYGKKTISMEYWEADDSAVITTGSPSAFLVRIVLQDQSGQVLDRKYAVRPLILNQY